MYLIVGVSGIPSLELTEDNKERTFQTNHLGHFALTALLIPILSMNGARVINVSSDMHWMVYFGLDLDNLNGENFYSPMKSYAASKLQNILFTKELQRRIDSSSNDYKNVKAFALTPGLTRTDIFRYSTQDFVSMMDIENNAIPFYFSLKTLKQLVWSYFTEHFYFVTCF
jgi:NAD(P)-dependent dehydrogenase (short-subunit alcohol dehydrogenase family)